MVFTVTSLNWVVRAKTVSQQLVYCGLVAIPIATRVFFNMQIFEQLVASTLELEQVFYMLQGTMKVYAHGELKATLNEGDAILVLAGETHSVVNDEDLECIYYAVTVPPLDKTH